MHCPPIIERELRVATRKLDVRKMRWNISIIGCLVSTVLLLIGLAGGESFIREAFPFLFVGAIYYILTNTFVFAGGMFVQEKEEQTLGFLFLAGLTMPEIFITKIAGAILIAMTRALAFIPFMAIPFLTGGISFEVFWAAVWCLPNLVVLALALSTFGSVRCKEESAATTLSQLLAGTLAVFTTGLHWLASVSGVKLSSSWLLFSPAYGPWLIVKNFSYGSASDYWWNCVITLVWSVLFFAAAAVILRRTWQRETTSSEGAFWQRFVPQCLARSERWKRQRAALLDDNPFAWRATYDGQSQRLAWAILGGTGALWCFGWLLIGSAWVTVPNFFVTATVVTIELTAIVLYAAAKHIASDRRSGALEIFLVTPMTPVEIVKGQIIALRRQFRIIAWFTSVLWLALALVGLGLRSWDWRSLLVYTIAWSLLIYFSLSLCRRNVLGAFYGALISGRASFAVWKCASLGSIYSWWWLFFNGKNLFSGVYGFPTGNTFELLIFAFVVPLGAIVTLIYRQNDPMSAIYDSEYNLRLSPLIADFRKIAQSPIPAADDERFKKWHPTERFPVRNV